LGLLHILGYIHSLGSGGPVEEAEAENQQDSHAERFPYHVTLLSGPMLELPVFSLSTILLSLSCG
jgi:hypothetical protein